VADRKGEDREGRAPEELLPGAAIGYRHLIESLPAITHLSRLDPTASTIYISPQVEDVTGYASAEWVADSELWTRLLHPDDRARLLAANEAHVQLGRAISEDYRLVARDGRVVWIHEESHAIRGKDGTLLGSQGILTDITERVRDEEHHRRQARAHARLVQQLVEAQEAERARMARVIHDDAIQVLTAIGLRVELLAGDLREGAEDATLRATNEAVRRAIERLRSVLVELEPPALDREGLVGAILPLLREMQPQGSPRWEVENLLPKEPPNTIRLVAYRIAQEAILNVRKHSRARNVSIRFETSEGGLLVTIQDDGVGFDPSKPDPIPLGNRGLNSMRDRAEAAGGLTVVDSLPGHGTTVRLWLPM
jgi:PAS domain S-box-containing protein